MQQVEEGAGGCADGGQRASRQADDDVLGEVVKGCGGGVFLVLRSKTLESRDAPLVPALERPDQDPMVGNCRRRGPIPSQSLSARA